MQLWGRMMETSGRGPTIGRVSSFGHYYRDELAKGEKRSRRREVRYEEERQWRREVEEDLAEEGIPEVPGVWEEPSGEILQRPSREDVLYMPKEGHQRRTP